MASSVSVVVSLCLVVVDWLGLDEVLLMADTSSRRSSEPEINKFDSKKI